MKLVVILLALFQLMFAVHAQFKLPSGAMYTCYDSTDCSGTMSSTDTTVQIIENPCCITTAATETPLVPAVLREGSFTIGDRSCRSCDHTSVQTAAANTFSTCFEDSICTAGGSPRFDLNGEVTNDCCNGDSFTQSYETNGAACDTCFADSVGVGNDPHFYLPLRNEENLCFSVQGEPDFAFNLIKDDNVNLNAQFVLPAEDESNTIANVSTFLGSLGLVVKNPVTGNVTKIQVSAQDHSVLVGNSLSIIRDKPISVRITNKVAITVAEGEQTDMLNDASAWLDISTNAGFGIKVRFYKKHLDMFLTDTSGLTKEAHGLIGQFLGVDVEVDAENNLIRFGDRQPIPAEKAPAWPFLGIPDQCWYGTATDNQGAGIIEGKYTDYIVEHLIEPKKK